jgi:hypothetical protein
MAALRGDEAVAHAVARLDAWLETMRGPRGYAGPVVHWWRHNFLFTDVGLDWRYEGIMAGYLSLWKRSGDDRWLDRARRAGDDLMGGHLASGHFVASAFEMNPASGGTPHEAACDVALLLLAQSLRQQGDPAWKQYAECAEHNLRLYYVGQLWDAEARAFRDSPHTPSFVPNKAATAAEAIFLLAEVREDASWVEEYALSTLDRVAACQVRDGGPLDGAIAQNSIGRRRIDKYFPLYIARCVPALMRGYRWANRESLADCAARAVRFLWRCVREDGSLPAVVYPSHRSSFCPSWIAPLGDVLRAADSVPPFECDGRFDAVRRRLLAGQDDSGGIQTAYGFAAQAGGRTPPVPDVSDLMHVTGWCDKAFRYLASQAAAPVPQGASLRFEAECSFRGQRMHFTETQQEVVVSAQREIRYHWLKGAASPQKAAPEFWLG